MPKLLIEEGGQASVFELFEDEVSIGRGANNDVQVADAHASKHHAAIRSIGGRPKLVDLESKNGTRVNGAFANQRWLTHGDTIAIGGATMTFDASDVATRAPAPARISVRAPAAAPAVAAAAAPAPSRPIPQIEIGRATKRRPTHERRRDDDYDDEDEGPRQVARRGSNSAMIAVGVGAGVLAVFALLYLLISHMGGTSGNAMALVGAKQLENQGKIQEAREYLAKYGNPSDEDGYKSVKEEIDLLDAQLANKAVEAIGDDAQKEYSQLVRYYIELHKSDHSRERLATDLRAYAEKFMGTPAVHELLNIPNDYPAKLRAVMGEDKAFDAMADLKKAYAEWKDTLYAQKRPADTPNAELGARIQKFTSDFAGSIKVRELERSNVEPYPALRAIGGVK